jgi:hypothetical protein
LAIDTDKAVLIFNDPTTGGRILELRMGGDSGAQTVFPGSIHEEGEPIAWEENGEPASVDGDDLTRRVHDLAAYSLIARYWPAPGLKARHNVALIVGGFLARAGKSQPEIKLAVEAIARAANDSEWRNRREAAEDAATAYHTGKHTFGFPAMRKQFGDDIAYQIAEWLGYEHFGEPQEESPTAEPEAEELPPLPFINMSKWDNEPVPEQEWAVPDRIPLGQTTLFTGEGGYGKSTVQLHLCAAHALGLSWLNTLPDPGPSIFFEAEDGEKIIHRRLAAMPMMRRAAGWRSIASKVFASAYGQNLGLYGAILLLKLDETYRGAGRRLLRLIEKRKNEIRRRKNDRSRKVWSLNDHRFEQGRDLVLEGIASCRKARSHRARARGRQARECAAIGEPSALGQARTSSR